MLVIQDEVNIINNIIKGKRTTIKSVHTYQLIVSDNDNSINDPQSNEVNNDKKVINALEKYTYSIDK